MGLQSFLVVFDSPTGAYYAGQLCTGKVILNIDAPKKIRAISISFKGEAEVRWTESREETQQNGETRSENVHFTADETYFENKYNLLGGGGSEITIEAGEHVYPFSTSIPPTVPSSFEGEHGHIRYKVKVTLDRPWKFDQHAEAPFTIVTPYDLNFDAKAKEPVKKEQNKFFCCFCCKSGPLTMVLTMPYSGFTPGQELPFTIEVDNASNIDVSGVKCEIIKEITYKARSPSSKTKTSKADIVKVKLEGVPSNNSKTWSQSLSIPQMPFHNLAACSIIKIAYGLKAVTVVSGAHMNLETEVPLILGSTPINVPASSFAQPALPAMNPASPPESQDPSIGFSIEPTAPSAYSLYPNIPIMPISTKEVA